MNALGTHIQVWQGGWSPDEIRAAAEQAAEIGYQFLEIPVRAPETIEAGTIVKILESFGMFCTTSFVHGLDTDIASDDPAIAANGERLMLEALATARDLGSRRLVGGMHSALAKFDTQRTDGGRQNAVDVLRRVAERAQEMDMVLCIEALNRYESNFMNTAAQLLGLIGEIGADNVYAHLDTFHMNIEETDPARAIRACGDRLGYFHVAENYRGYLGTGSIDFQAIFRALSEIGYAHPISLEVFSSAVCNPLHSARLAVWREVWSDSGDIARHSYDFIRNQLDTTGRLDR
jgi:D-psicose/D-tagatose/L-ribulose 3-epimerase